MRIQITLDLNETQQQQLHKSRGKVPVADYLRKKFNTQNVRIIEAKKNPSWLGDLEDFEKELSKY